MFSDVLNQAPQGGGGNDGNETCAAAPGVNSRGKEASRPERGLHQWLPEIRAFRSLKRLLEPKQKLFLDFKITESWETRGEGYPFSERAPGN